MPSRSDRRRLIAAAKIWTLPLWLVTCRSPERATIGYEVDRWIECIDDPGLRRLGRRSRFAYLAGALPEFRTLLHYRLRSTSLPLRLLLRAIYPPEPTLMLKVDRIEPGLFIQHGTATLISAESIGRDCWINHQVTIGYDARGRPTLGNHVRVGAAAVVVGAITLHDNATVGANATVIDDVPTGVTVVAPLARPLEQAERRTRPR
jgi:serine O-acetyltransferase